MRFLNSVPKKNIFHFFLSFFIYNVTASASSINVNGTVSGQWNYDTVIVSGNIELPFNQTLIIQPGCKVLFDGYYRFTVWGKLIALGDSLNPIRFERKDTMGFYHSNIDGAWDGMKVGSASATPSVFEYCIFQFIKGSGLTLEIGYSSFRHCRFENNRNGVIIYLLSKGHRITNSVFSNNESGRIVYMEGRYNDTLFFENNTIVNNTGTALDHYGYVKSVCVVTNNIFWNNGTSQSNPTEITYTRYDSYGFDTSTLLLRNCIIKNGNLLTFFNSSCFTLDPMFVNPAQGNFSLRWDNYPLVDATRSIGIDHGYYLSPPDDDSSISDIGAIPFFRIERRNHTWARFDIDTALGYLSNLTVHFTNLSNTVVTPVNWIWDFGDGNTSTDRNPIHTYLQTGIFTLKLKAIDQDGHQDSLVIENAVKVLPGKRINPGSISGIWEKQYSPYYVYGDIFVPDNNKLIIKPGVEVRFMGSYSLDVYGSLFAQGSAIDTISFKTNDTTGMTLYKNMNMDFPFADFQRSKGWVGIHFLSDLSEQDTCIMSYCKISDVRIGNPYSSRYRGALKLHRIKTSVIKNSLFINNFTVPQYYITIVDTPAYNYQTAGIASVGSNPVIEGNRFENLYQIAPAAIYLIMADSVKVTNNTFINLSNAAAIEYVKSYQFINNKLDSIRGLCLRLDEDDPAGARRTFNEVSGNTFSNSGRGILAAQQPRILSGVYKIRFANNIFRNNRGQIDVCLSAYGDSIYISNNLFYNNSVTYEISNVGGTCMNVLLKNSMTGVIANNTLVDNYGFGNFQSIIYGDDSLKLYNNIVRNKAGVELQATYFTGSSWFFSTFKKSYNNNVKGGYAPGFNNYDESPNFLDTLNHDYRLKKTSSSINRGYSDTLGLFLPALDFFGNPRVDPYIAKIDVGIYEYISQKPVQLQLSRDSIKENLPNLTGIGKLTTVDPDSDNTHTYTLVNIPGVANNNTDFIITSDSLRSGAIFNMIQNPRHVSIRSTNQFGASYDTSFTIRITSNPIVTAVSNIADIRDFVSFYPMPFKESLIIDAKDNTTGIWQIYSIKGEMILSGSYRNKTTLNLSSLPAGAYILKLTIKKKLYAANIMKQ